MMMLMEKLEEEETKKSFPWESSPISKMEEAFFPSFPIFLGNLEEEEEEGRRLCFCHFLCPSLLPPSDKKEGERERDVGGK